MDPYGQYASPYLGMGNNPVSNVDPNGGYELKFLADIARSFNKNILGKEVGDIYTSGKKYGFAVELKDGSFGHSFGVQTQRVWTHIGIGITLVENAIYNDKLKHWMDTSILYALILISTIFLMPTYLEAMPKKCV